MKFTLPLLLLSAAFCSARAIPTAKDDLIHGNQPHRTLAARESLPHEVYLGEKDRAHTLIRRQNSDSDSMTDSDSSDDSDSDSDSDSEDDYSRERRRPQPRQPSRGSTRNGLGNRGTRDLERQMREMQLRAEAAEQRAQEVEERARYMAESSKQPRSRYEPESDSEFDGKPIRRKETTTERKLREAEEAKAERRRRADQKRQDRWDYNDRRREEAREIFPGASKKVVDKAYRMQITKTRQPKRIGNGKLADTSGLAVFRKRPGHKTREQARREKADSMREREGDTRDNDSNSNRRSRKGRGGSRSRA